MGYSQRRVVELLGHRRHGLLSSLEAGQSLPKLETALKLELITRTPVAFLFPNLYDHLKQRIRAMEEPADGRARKPGVRRVPNHSPAKRL
jgi:hypothetical protein